MDLMILIVVLLGAFLLYYLIETIRSLHQEIKEIKTKCVNTDSKDNKDIEFKTSTVDPMVGMNKSLINNMNYLKNYFDINK
uniref:Uncharacterized protein n=1 Tax=viral metagenome TaxID=1070528 RepID=A0A6C0J034_9ZZZZ